MQNTPPTFPTFVYPKVSVIMASYLGDYPNAATNRPAKLYRAVKSFQEQTYRNCELIIVADGCEQTKDFYRNIIAPSGVPGIKYTWLDKQPMFSGRVRETGILIADGELICYLDTDDYFERDHIEKIIQQFPNDKIFKWMYFDDLVLTNANHLEKRRRVNKFSEGRVGTSAIVHRKEVKARWRNGYGHDWDFIRDLYKEQGNTEVYANAPNGYVVCHIPGQVDF